MKETTRAFTAEMLTVLQDVLTKMDIELLYSDRHIAVCIKPVGVNSQGKDEVIGNGTDISDDNMPDLIRKAIGKDNAYVGTVHRLDKNVGGIMVYSLDKKITGKLIQSFSSHECVKEYSAVISGKPDNDTGVLSDLLYHDTHTNKTFVVNKERKGVKRAELEYRTEYEVTLPNGSAGTVISVILHTGRTHQIRVQFASRKMPVYGDARYGGGKGDPMLYSHRLTLVHPITNKIMTFEKKAEWEK